MIYCTFENESLVDIAKIITLLKGSSTEKLIKTIKNYKDKLKEHLTVFEHILNVYASTQSPSSHLTY